MKQYPILFIKIFIKSTNSIRRSQGKDKKHNVPFVEMIAVLYSSISFKKTFIKQKHKESANIPTAVIQGADVRL